MSLDRRFVASLIANAFFFSTFPVRASCLAPPLSDLSFGALFHNVGSSFVQVKLITIFFTFKDKRCQRCQRCQRSSLVFGS